MTGVALCLTAALIAGCGPSPPELPKTVGPSTQTAWASQRAATPTTRPTATFTPAPTATEDLAAVFAHLSTVGVSSQDLPAGFSAVPLELLGVDPSQLPSLIGESNVTTANQFSLVNDNPYQVLVGFTVFLPDSLSQAGFDSLIGRPEILLDSMLTAVGAVSVKDRSLLYSAESIGPHATGMTAGMLLKQFPSKMRADAVFVRNGRLGAVVFEVYAADDIPLITVIDVGRMLESKMSAAQR